MQRLCCFTHYSGMYIQWYVYTAVIAAPHMHLQCYTVVVLHTCMPLHVVAHDAKWPVTTILAGLTAYWPIRDAVVTLKPTGDACIHRTAEDVHNVKDVKHNGKGNPSHNTGDTAGNVAARCFLMLGVGVLTLRCKESGKRTERTRPSHRAGQAIEDRPEPLHSQVWLVLRLRRQDDWRKMENSSLLLWRCCILLSMRGQHW